jgi:hypothetical protein
VRLDLTKHNRNTPGKALSPEESREWALTHFKLPIQSDLFSLATSYAADYKKDPHRGGLEMQLFRNILVLVLGSTISAMVWGSASGGLGGKKIAELVEDRRKALKEEKKKKLKGKLGKPWNCPRAVVHISSRALTICALSIQTINQTFEQIVLFPVDVFPVQYSWRAELGGMGVHRCMMAACFGSFWGCSGLVKVHTLQKYKPHDCASYLEEAELRGDTGRPIDSWLAVSFWI